MTGKERILIFLLAAVNFTHILDFMIMMPLGNYLMPAYDINPTAFSILLSSYPIAAFASGIFMAFNADRFERRSTLLVTYAGFILFTAACGFADSFGTLLVFRALTGIFGGILGGQVLSIISDLFTYERRGTAMGAVMSSFAIAASAGVTFSLYLVNLFGDDWHVPFLFVSGIGTMLLGLSWRYLPQLRGHLATPPGESKWRSFTGILQDARYRNALLFSGLMMMGHFLIVPFINPYLEFNKGYPRSVTPLIYLIGGIASFLAAILLGKLSDRVGKLAVFSWCVPLSFIFVVVLTNLPPLPFSMVLLFFACWFALATGRAVSSQTLVSSVPDAASRGSFMSLNSSVQQLGTGLASVCAGWIVSDEPTGQLIRYEWVGYGSIAVLLAAFFMGRKLFRNTDKVNLPT
ncbi:MAG: hypothetical protein RJA57_142 [Bacteroidota bacterium]